jgi:hypothetical protein
MEEISNALTIATICLLVIFAVEVLKDRLIECQQLSYWNKLRLDDKIAYYISKWIWIARAYYVCPMEFNELNRKCYSAKGNIPIYLKDIKWQISHTQN